MKTEELVTALSTPIGPVNGRLVSRTVYIAVAAGMVVALGMMLVVLGARTDLMTARAFAFLQTDHSGTRKPHRAAKCFGNRYSEKNTVERERLNARP